MECVRGPHGSRREVPAGIEDIMLRYMPSVAGALYVQREGDIPGAPGAGGAAGAHVVWLNGRHGWHPYLETSTFIHELMHVCERRLRLACLPENRKVNGWMLHENGLRAYDADRRRRRPSSRSSNRPA